VFEYGRPKAAFYLFRAQRLHRNRRARRDMFGFCIANPTSFGAKSNRGVNPRGALCGQPAGKRNRGGEDCAAAYPREDIRRGHFSPVILN
jgi:hypothetical protein